MLNIVIPMAGRGSRFSEAGFDIPSDLKRFENLSFSRAAAKLGQELVPIARAA